MARIADFLARGVEGGSGEVVDVGEEFGSGVASGEVADVEEELGS